MGLKMNGIRRIHIEGLGEIEIERMNELDMKKIYRRRLIDMLDYIFAIT
jgi:hypothetical protein